MNIKIIALIAVVGIASGAQALLLTGRATSVDGVGFGHNLLMGTIEGKANFTINIMKIGIGGDADDAAGKQVFGLQGGGLDFTWGAGQEQNPPFELTYVLAPTQQTESTLGRSLSYLDIDGQQEAAMGQSVNVFWRGTADWDGGYTLATDILGNQFNDSAFHASARAWVQYEYQAVPEPCAIAGILVGVAGVLRRRRNQGQPIRPRSRLVP